MNKIHEQVIDPSKFEKQFIKFRKFVEGKSGVPFISFPSNPYTEEQEGYKYEIYRQAREALVFQAWKETDIGSGEIISSTIEAIEIPLNNLVSWQAKYGEDRRPHQALYKAGEKSTDIEKCLFKLYHGSNDSESFSELISIFGKKYSLIAYLFFIKDKSRYLPLAPTYFDKSFQLLGAEFKTARHCSLENYQVFLYLIGELKYMLSELMHSEVSLLDAHSFAWILVAQMQSEYEFVLDEEDNNLETTERESIINSRIGQSQFRKRLIQYWGRCYVTGCSKTELLLASHIKPWSQSSNHDRLSIFNGLLLSPNLDYCFDKGYISFDNEGHILISSKLGTNDLQALAIDNSMSLDKIEDEHKKYLSYHRENIFVQ